MRRTATVTVIVVAVGATASAARAARALHLGDRLPLRSGMKGHDVRVLQRYLGRLGHRVEVDGSFGPATASALRRWERSAALPPDGAIDRPELPALLAAARTGAQVAVFSVPPPVPVPPASLGPDGLATAPPGAPLEVVGAILAANQIAKLPYRYGGGHVPDLTDDAYDCSGSVSFALHGAGLLEGPLDSTALKRWGVAGPGRWISVYANSRHAFAVIAGLRFDTTGRGTAGTRWQQAARSPAGFRVRHPAGL